MSLGYASSSIPTVTAFVNFAASKVGGPYLWGGTGPVAYDCSGLVQAAAASIGVTFPRVTDDQYQACVNAGTNIAVADAINTYGALLFMSRAVDPSGHVAISLGNGQTVEAADTALGIIYGNAVGAGYDEAGLLPGLQYVGTLGPTSGNPAVSTTGATGASVPAVLATYPAPPTAVAPFSPIPGLGTLSVGDIVINGSAFNLDVSEAIQDIIVERSVGNPSTITLQIDDPQRAILRSGLFSQGDQLTLNGLNFVLSQYAKSQNTIQLVFEAQGVYLLRQQMNGTDPLTGIPTVPGAADTFNLSGFAYSLVSQIPGLGFVGETDAFAQQDQTYTGTNIGGVSIGRGTSSDPWEDSWTCLVRIATAAGWRVWENAGTIYFGSDEFWLSYFPTLGTLTEFTEQALYIDFDWDVGKPLGQATITAMTKLWEYPPGTPIQLQGLGPADQIWLVSDMQRDLYNPTATITCEVPMFPPALIANASGATTTQTITSSGTPGTPGFDPGSPGSGTPEMTITITPSINLSAGEAFQISCLVDGHGYGVTPTGTVTFFSNGANDAWGTNLKLVNGVATASIPKGWGTGPYVIYAEYAPDASSKWAPNTTQNELITITVQ